MGKENFKVLNMQCVINLQCKWKYSLQLSSVTWTLSEDMVVFVGFITSVGIFGCKQ